MRFDTRKLAFAALLATGIAAGAVAGTQSLEDLLRAREPAVTRWQVQPLGEQGASHGADFAGAQLGRVAARTPVRFVDGRVRWYAVAGYREVLVSARVLEGAEVIDADAARLESRDVLALGCEPIARLDEARRWRARRRLGAGEVLCASTIEPAPEVERNRSVTLSAHSGVIQVSRVLIAANDAHVGERVRLRDRDGTSLVAIVTGPGAARIPGATP